MVVAVGVTVTNIENGIAESVAKNELNEIFQDIRNRFGKELQLTSWQLSSDSFYSYTYQLELPILLARRYQYIIEIESDADGNYQISASASFLGSLIEVSEPLGLSDGIYSISGSLNSIFDIHRVTIEKNTRNAFSIDISSRNL
jgi:hypothetical protein